MFRHLIAKFQPLFRAHQLLAVDLNASQAAAMSYMSPPFKPFSVPERWPLKNTQRFEPQQPDEPIRRATYCHFRDNIKYSPKKMWYICCLIRGLSIDEAIKQLSFVDRKGAHIAKEVLLEAQEIAVNEHNFEYKSNMYIGECFATKGLVIKGIRKHAFYRLGEVRYFHTHFFVRLVEGPPPTHYYLPPPKTNKEKLQDYIDGLRKRNIKFSH
ncbi:39S ribosomal protein L22-like protein [Dinothrombium tinctorium]|uniref:Large ribosomal subunit protein uL22m n=1 Tax=Dinothrombium tinctorium TaxID=1965070 RepID=A0A443R6V8_9ACAR|nr:39S ribosomal protein L22-like protein [Dinothrombium tinctorium]